MKALVLVAVFVGVAYAKMCPQLTLTKQQEVRPGDITDEQGIFFGHYVKVFGRRMVAGGYGLEGYRGGAWTYELDSDGIWQFDQKLVLPQRSAGDYTGLNVGIWGKRVVVGAPFDEPRGKRSGSAHVYEIVEGHWVHTAQLTAPDAHRGAYFGYAVDIEKDYIVVGARYANNNETGTQRAGAAYVYKRRGLGDWELLQILRADDGNAQTYDEVRIFGSTKAGPTRILAGAPRSTSQKGVALVYEADSEGKFELKQRLSGQGANNKAHYGEGISLSENYIALGGEGAVGPNGPTGAVAMFELQEDGSYEQTELLYPDRKGKLRFGQRVSQRGPIALVGAWTSNESGRNSGSAYMFGECDDGSWEQLEKVVIVDADGNPSGQEQDLFGKGVHMSKKHMAIGAPKRDFEGQSNIGAVYMYSYSFEFVEM